MASFDKSGSDKPAGPIWKKYLGYVFVLEIKAEFSSAKSIPARKV
jgi:hypothetical protein